MGHRTWLREAEGTCKSLWGFRKGHVLARRGSVVFIEYLDEHQGTRKKVLGATHLLVELPCPHGQKRVPCQLPVSRPRRDTSAKQEIRASQPQRSAPVATSRLAENCAMVPTSTEPAMVIQVQLNDMRTGEPKTLCFEQSPIRIGRNQLNNIAIEDPFVSEWHGIIRFDASGIYYFDLGSTNGTSMEGKRLPKNTITPLTGSTKLTIWPFQLSAVAQSSAPTAGVPATAAWGVSQRSGGLLRAADLAPAGPDRASAVRPEDRGQEPPRPNQQAASFPSFAGRKTEDVPVRVMCLFETFIETFVGLKKGYEEFGAEVGVRPLSGGSPLHRARSSREVIDYLLDPAADTEARSRDLRAVFADMGIHHIAFMEGLTQGIRALLESLDPSAQENHPSSGLFNRSRAKAEWRSYVERFATLIAEDAALHAQIFGEEFARGYASVALGGSRPDPEDSEGSE